MAYEDQPDPPFAIQIELVEGCPLYCNFCGLQGIRTKKEKDYKFMTPRTLRTLCRQLGDWNPRIELAMHGEPTVHPELERMIRIIRRAKPKASIMLTTNGYGFLKDPMQTMTALFDAGLNVIALDEYEYVNWHQKIRSSIDNPTFSVGEYPKDKSLSPNKKWSPTSRQLILTQDISTATNGTHSKFNNHCGAAFPLDYSKTNQRCIKPFREVSVRWDGNIAICCNDWRGKYLCGNIHQTPLHDIWAGPGFRTVRRFLYHKNRPLAPCYGCNDSGHRLGLLPDKKGKETLPEPTRRDLKLWKEHCEHPQVVTFIKRDYE